MEKRILKERGLVSIRMNTLHIDSRKDFGRHSYSGKLRSCKTAGRRFSALFFAVFFAFSMMIVVPEFSKAEGQGPDVNAEGYCVMNAATGEVVCGKNQYVKFYPASITKILTALIIYENLPEEDLDNVLSFSHDAVVTNLTRDSSTLSPVAKEGEQMTVDQALHGMMLASANECANALAEYLCGSNEAFAVMMNNRIAEMGIEGSHFANPSGLDDENQYTTAYDMAVIARTALANPKVKALMSVNDYVLPATNLCKERAMHSGHALINGSYHYETEDEISFSGKGGLTDWAGRTLVTYADRGDTALIITLMKDKVGWEITDTEVLMDFAFPYLDHKVPEVIFEERDEVITTFQDTNLYQFMGTYTLVTAILKPGEELRCTGKYLDWYRVEYANAVHYVPLKNVNLCEEDETKEDREPTSGRGKHPEKETLDPNLFYADPEDPSWKAESAPYDLSAPESHGAFLNILSEHYVAADDLSTFRILLIVGGAALLGIILLVGSLIFEAYQLHVENREQKRRKMNSHKLVLRMGNPRRQKKDR